MKKIITFAITLILAVTCFTLPAFAATDKQVSDAVKAGADFIYAATPSPEFNDEWNLYALYEAGYSMPAEYVEGYMAQIEKKVKESDGVLSEKKYTEYSRLILTMTVLGLDPTDVAGYNLVEKLSDYDAVCYQGLNGPIWALIAINSGFYTCEAEDKYVETVLNAQLSDGGWAFNGTKADPDMTAMAMYALSPYYRDGNVKDALNKGVACLSKLQNADGSYSSYNTPNSESTAWVIKALSRLGINPNTDSRFKKNGKSAVDALLTFRTETGAFKHMQTGKADQMATQQAVYSLGEYTMWIPKKGAVSSAKKSTSTKIKVTCKSAGTDGYQIVIAKNKSFSSGKKTYTGTSRTKMFTSLTKGKTYYVKVRGYNVISGKKVYGLYSSIKTVKL